MTSAYRPKVLHISAVSYGKRCLSDVPPALVRSTKNIAYRHCFWNAFCLWYITWKFKK